MGHCHLLVLGSLNPPSYHPRTHSSPVVKSNVEIGNSNDGGRWAVAEAVVAELFLELQETEDLDRDVVETGGA